MSNKQLYTGLLQKVIYIKGDYQMLIRKQYIYPYNTNTNIIYTFPVLFIINIHVFILIDSCVKMYNRKYNS